MRRRWPRHFLRDFPPRKTRDAQMHRKIYNILLPPTGWHLIPFPPPQRHPRRPRGSQSSREKRCDESFQAQAEEPLGTDSHRIISKRSSECWLLIGHKKCFVLLCPIGEQHLLSSFREFVHYGYWLDHGVSGSCTKQMHAVRKLSVWYKHLISKYRFSLH